MENLLQKLLEKNLVDIYDETPENWENALYIAGEGLKREGFITDKYLDEIVKNVKDNGPYIVIVPGVVMPHASAKSVGVLGTAIGFAKFPNDIVFDEKDDEKKGRLFFTLAARDDEEHLKNIGDLMDLLMTDGMIEELEKIQTRDDFKFISDQFEKGE